MKKSLLVVLLAALSLGSDSPRYDEGAEVDSLQGVWQVTDGLLTATVLLGDIRLVFHAGQVGSDREGGEVEGTYQMGRGRTLIPVDIKPSGAETLRCLCRRRGNTLEIAFGEKLADRPAGFGDRGLFIITLARQQK